MRALIQRVNAAKVIVNGKIVSQIKHGLCVMVGVCCDDTAKDAEFIAKKMLAVRLWPKDDKQWTVGVAQCSYEVLIVSQPSLYEKNACTPAEATMFYKSFVEKVKKAYKADKVTASPYGVRMCVDINNDGPVTIEIDSEPTDKTNAPVTVTTAVKSKRESKDDKPKTVQRENPPKKRVAAPATVAGPAKAKPSAFSGAGPGGPCLGGCMVGVGVGVGESLSAATGSGLQAFDAVIAAMASYSMR